MIVEGKNFDADTLIRWLKVMVEGMEMHQKDLYFQGAAKAYRTTIEALQTGNFIVNI